VELLSALAPEACALVAILVKVFNYDDKMSVSCLPDNCTGLDAKKFGGIDRK